MKDEKLAKEYAKLNARQYKHNDGIGFCTSEEEVEQAFLAGLKAGKDMADADLATIAYMQGAERYKPQWHKVADGDLPNNDRILSDQDGNNVRYVKHRNKWFYRDRTCEADVIAWCETLKYTEE